MTSPFPQPTPATIAPVEPVGEYTIVECRLETGRTHQIRIHLAETGHMLCGERTYNRPAPGAQPAGTLWCDCGWPYGMLLPSGASTPGGSPFKLVAVVTDHRLDHANEADTCGSMSFCGAADEYPDARAMGYPFDKPFPAADPLATISAHRAMAVRDLTIRCADHHP